MNIIKATKKALDEKKCIHRTDYPYVKIYPSFYMPFAISMPDGSNRVNNWNPTGEEILSDKWEICD